MSSVETSDEPKSVEGVEVPDGELVNGPPATRAGKLVRLGGTFLIFVAAIVFGGWPLFLMLAAFAISILLHEAGHFFVARRAGMKATEFFVGFGPKIFSFRKGETEYGLKVIPAGAYVRIIGMTNLEHVAPEDENRTYRSKPFRWRLATVVAGPAANLLLAFVLLLGVNLFAEQPNMSKWETESSLPMSTARAISLEEGESVIAIDGQPVDDYQSFVEQVRARSTKEATFTLRAADGSVREATAQVGWRLSASGADLLSPLAENDVVTSINGASFETFDEFAQIINNIPAGEVRSVEFMRQGGVYAAIIPSLPEDFTVDDTVGYFGVAPRFVRERLPVGDAVQSSVSMAGSMIVGSVKGVGSFFSPSGLLAFGSTVVNGGETTSPQKEITVIIPPTEGGGVNQADRGRILSVVGVVRLGAQAADTSLPAFLSVWILINIFLGIVNLLPLLPFDGGHAVVALWEKVRGMITHAPSYRVDSAKLIPVSYAVIAFFLLIGLSAMWLDLTAPVQNPFS